MSDSALKSLSAIGFLTVIEHQEHGLFGGYLVLNRGGRPLEFHCTAPVKPNRAQEILYGPTLADYLYGEQIGPALVENAKIRPEIICTDVEPLLATQAGKQSQLVLIYDPDKQDEPSSQEDSQRQWHRRDAGSHSWPQPPHTQLAEFTLAGHRLVVPQSRMASVGQLTSALAGFADTIELSEPFQRIRDAIEEAQQMGS